MTANKLYVVNETSPNPDDWSIWSEWVLVIASSPEEALQIVGAPGDEKVAEVDMSTAKVIVCMPEPAWGDDL